MEYLSVTLDKINVQNKLALGMGAVSLHTQTHSLLAASLGVFLYCSLLLCEDLSYLGVNRCVYRMLSSAEQGCSQTQSSSLQIFTICKFSLSGRSNLVASFLEDVAFSKISFLPPFRNALSHCFLPALDPFAQGQLWAQEDEGALNVRRPRMVRKLRRAPVQMLENQIGSCRGVCDRRCE